jgi:hypothetical protein
MACGGCWLPAPARPSFGHHARLEDDDRRLSRTTRSVAVEVLVQFAPPLPQPLTLFTHRSPPEHLAPDPTGQLDHRLRMGPQFQPPGRLSRTRTAPSAS